ncbi:hypothetical protein A3D00_05685 [Candidatus Woesebacteria bacterium RIFCSPHIGHO2_02_FULL_38_9]|uniref:SpoVT-AbrB domain-containing protein n=1 Tax=Candidatus Woesebacteria bacterium RIFCSPHIGHO2_01_FULL_39_28 TaxID=1802496 RepID=A0A1F7YIE9_9BACT|nr:MAG: hypothetical protein A2627_01885 [Candidatus Woesebacteria bacterium RIFCSPHIGHO2_01_FULL_39_28]OGM34256.1 MAG: hypothetical protein A3D00_05685 [Candidatus Woesebacteria bacterium RIFCSPHIGHO2_02_FULL_38_9]OGM57024.1 MAG: hypothetical protein A3A50_03505 [Candidatus Woesebacteria bacterium RIFCSPLOWO2_01_FULL_38_20]
MNLQTVSTTISGANQTAVPSLVRKLLDLNSGDRLIWKVEPEKKSVNIKVVPRNLGDYMSGLGKDVWEKIDVEKYIKESRKDRKIR